MPAGDFFVLWLHVLGLVAYGGATLALVAMVLPAAAGLGNATLRRTFLARALKVYDPLAIATLGIVVMSGATNLTTYKDALRGEFFQRIGWLLVWKLVLAFMVIMLGTYITFGLGHRIVRSELFDDPVDDAWLNSMSQRLTYACVLSLLLIAATAWLGLALGHPQAAAPTP